MGQGHLALPSEANWELVASEARSRKLDLDDYGNALPDDVAIRIDAAARAVLSAWRDAPGQVDARLTELRASVEPLLELIEAARRDHDAARAAAEKANPGVVSVGRGNESKVSPTATATLRRIERKMIVLQQVVTARPSTQQHRPHATHAGRRPAGRPRGQRRVGSSRGSPDGEPSPLGDPDPPGRPRAGRVLGDRGDSPLNRCWQLGLVLNVEELETLAVLASTRAVWLGRWDVAA